MRENIKIWGLSIVIVLFVIGGLAYVQKEFGMQEVFFSASDSSKNPKGFAQNKPLTENEKIAFDQAALQGALHSGALADCDKIEHNPGLKKQCEDRLNYLYSSSGQSPAGCEKIEDQQLRSLCQNKAYFLGATEKINLDLCQSITEPLLQEKCRNEIQFKIAKQTNTEVACQQISASDYKTQCLDAYYLKQASQAQTPASCSKLSTEMRQEQCRQTVAQNRTVAASSQKATLARKITRSAQDLVILCESIENLAQQTACKDTVYPRLAFEEKDLSQCNKISTSKGVQACRGQTQQTLDQHYFRTALSKKDLNLCQNIFSAALKELCLKN